ncbi:MAG: adenylosuccinate synthetase [Candidatus Marsarchaeota archaeon]|nr:adenylosuccinate synthetase [Candidatus Marsarchaeota archaeon]
MGVDVIVGGFFGDEGKGKIIAYHSLKVNAKIGVRAGGGPNAGHTVVKDGVTYRLRLIPSSFVNPASRLFISPGVLVDPDVLLSEVSALDVEGRIVVDGKAGLIESRHIERDRSSEFLSKNISTTGTGTGPAMEERVGRRLRLCSEDPRLSNMIGDTVESIHEELEAGGKVLAEGTQGTFLSLYHGTYPYVTSKDVTASAVCSDIGVGPKTVDEVMVVFKSYVTRVGNGPLRDELSEEELQARGWVERGTVTGRPRRAAPFDFDLAKKSVRLNGATCCAITKIDALFPSAKGVRSFSALPQEAKLFSEKVSSELGIRVAYMGTGPDLLDIVEPPTSTG